MPEEFLPPIPKPVDTSANPETATVDTGQSAPEPEPTIDPIFLRPIPTTNDVVANPEPPKRKGGRPKGSRNKTTKFMLERAQVVAGELRKHIPGAFTGDAHALLVSVYTDPSYPIELRV